MTRRLIRPLWVIGITWLLVCLVGAWLPTIGVGIAVVGSAAAALVTLIVPRWRRCHTAILTLLAVAAAGIVLTFHEHVRYQPIVGHVGEEVTVRVEVTMDPDVTRLTVLSGDLPRGTKLTLVAQPIDAPLKDHDIVEATFLLDGFSEDGLMKLQSKASGVWLAAMPVDMSAMEWQIERGIPTWWERLADGRDLLTEKIHRMIGGDIGAVITGICFGSDEKLSADTVSAFRSCGVSHLFAVSGLHLSVLTQVLLYSLKRLLVPRRVRGILTAAAVLVFSALVGWTPSVTRAGILCLLVVLGGCFRRQADARNSMGLALILLLSENPFAAYDVGLLLSFLATFGLLFVSPQLSERLQRLSFGKLQRAWNAIASTMSITASATLATLPVTVLYFGRVSLAGLLANLLMTAAASAVLVLGWAAVPALLCGWAVIYRPLLWIAGWLSRLLLLVAQGISQLPLATVQLREGYLLVWLGGALLLGWLGYRLFRYRGVAIVAAGAMAILAVGSFARSWLQQDTVCIHSLSEDETAVLVRYEENAVLVLAPEKLETLYAAREALSAKGVANLSAVYFPAGDHRFFVYAESVFDEYAAPMIMPDGVERPLWDVGSAAWYDSQLRLTVNGTQLVFHTEDAVAEADGVFHNGDMTLYVEGKPYCFKENVPDLCIKDGALLVK